MRPLPVAARLCCAVLASVVVVLTLAGPLLPSASAAPADPAERADRVDRADRASGRGPAAPGSLTGYVFDTCSAPAQEVMDAWWLESAYSGVGVYIGGSNRLCPQPELDAGWVRTQLRRGWHVLPLYVGPQASCSGYADRMSSDLTAAGQQGRAAAGDAVALAQGLGLRKGATLYYDLEDFDIAPDDCRRAALSFLSGWTDALHGRGYDSGVYSNIAAAITALDYANFAAHGSYSMPDDIWFAWANGRADTRTSNQWVRTDAWDDHARVHQYRTDLTETHGGYTLSVDQNWADVGRGSLAPAARSLCRGVDVDLRRYPTLKAGSRGPAVEAAQCLLRRTGFSKAAITGRYDARTAAAVRKAQARLDQKVTGKLTRTTWAALFARGSRPVLKVGSTGEQVRRLQRALSAAGKRTAADGLFSQRTAKAVERYQKKAGLPAIGVVTPEVWAALSGR